MRLELPGWVIGAVLAAMAALGYALQMPVLRGAEGRLTDWLFRYGRPDAPAASTDIVHLDIDDNSLDTIGRWPWPRKRLADALQVMDEMGVRAIAIDILLLEPQDRQWLENGRSIDNDRLLEQTLKSLRAKVVLAAHADRTAVAVWPDLRDLLRNDITLTPSEIAQRLDLDGTATRAVQENIRGFKKAVVEERAGELFDQGRLSLQSLRESLLPKRSGLGDFPELGILRRAVAQEQSIRSVESKLPRAQAAFPHTAVRAVLAPLPRFARAVHGIGMVNALQDPDGRLRRISLRWQRRGVLFPQLGLAAAAAYLDLPLDFLAQRELVAGRAKLGTGELLISWPRIDPARRLMHHLPLLSLLSLKDGEAKLAVQGAAREGVLRRLVDEATEYEAVLLDDASRRQKIIEELEGEIEFQLEDDAGVNEDETAGDPDARARKRTRNLMREYLRRTAELKRGQAQLSRARQRLRVELNDKLVFVGSNATGNFGDFYPTALGERTPGVVAHALVANSVLTGYVVHEAPIALGVLVTLLLGIAAAVTTVLVGPRLAFLLAVLLASLYFAFNTLFLFAGHGLVLALGAPLSSIFLAWAGTTVQRAVQERREKALLRKQFGTRISKRLFQHLMEHPEAVQMEGEEREVTCFFSDLAGFTSISEKLDSRTTVALLNRYMWAMNDELSRRLAYVNKFLGDGIMAVWGAFDPRPPHAERACRAALACTKRLETLNGEELFRDFPPLRMRIGIATGVVTVGDCGAPPDLRDYTVIGDSVNLAARLESASKQFGTHMLINGRCKQLLPDEILTRPLGRITVVGQTTPNEIHELLALRGEESDEQRALIDRTSRAVELFRNLDFEASRRAWQELDHRHGPSKLAGLYLHAIDRALAQPAQAFDGVLHLERK